MDVIKRCDKEIGLQGWRKINRWMKGLKSSYRKTANIHQKKGKDYKLGSISFDRGFYSKLAKEALEKKVENVIMPSKGKKTSEQKEQGDDKTIKGL